MSLSWPISIYIDLHRRVYATVGAYRTFCNDGISLNSRCSSTLGHNSRCVDPITAIMYYSVTGFKREQYFLLPCLLLLLFYLVLSFSCIPDMPPNVWKLVRANGNFASVSTERWSKALPGIVLRW